jgi:endonuclease/exonuclease/phosphatase family metal-dependent hydrolase
MRPLRRSGLLLILWMCLGLWIKAPSASALESPLRVAAFNIQVFGQTKIQNPATTRILLQILDRYDLIFIQEIRDANNSAIFELLDRLNTQSGKTYRALVSDRLGRTSSKEQYAFFYNEERIAPMGSWVYPDRSDVFEREPFVGNFRAGHLDFAIIGIHVTPRNVLGELQALNSVYRDTVQAYPHGNVLVMGDMNGDCNYYDASLGFQYFDTPALEVIPTGVDTTVAQASCTYDRVLALGPIGKLVHHGMAFNFAQSYGLSPQDAKAVSDHYPVEFNLDIQEPVSKTQPNPVPAQGEVCGLNPYVTPRGYCYAIFGSGKKRVSGSCCTLIQAS